MTKSFPWAGVVGGAGAGDDSGRYTAGEWWSVWGIQQSASGLIVPTVGASLRTLAAWTNVGVYYGVEDRLEVTDGGGFVADVATGAALVEGTLFYENTARALTMPASQTYYVVVRKNYSAVDYTPPGYAAGDGVVPAYTCRITWVAAIVQDTTRVTYWDIPLATVVTDGSEITTVTDTREWVDAVLKSLWVNPTYNVTDAGGGVIEGTATFGYLVGWNMEDLVVSTSAGSFTIPGDYIYIAASPSLVIYPVFINMNDASGNIRMTINARYGDCGEIPAVVTTGYTTEAFAAGSYRINCVSSLSSANFLPGNIIGLETSRDATHGDDSIGDRVFFAGWLVQYMGWR